MVFQVHRAPRASCAGSIEGWPPRRKIAPVQPRDPCQYASKTREVYAMSMIAVNGTQLWVEDEGAGPPIMFSHSLFFDSGMFVHQAAAFAPTHRVIRYDHRGQGRSDPAPRADLDIDQLTRDAAALIEALDAGPCHFVGNSLGGFVALRLAARRPDLVRSVAILGSSGEAEHRAAEFAPLVEAMRSHGAAPLIATLMHIMFGDTYLADPARAAERAHWQAKLQALPPAIADAAHAVVFRAPVLDELAACRVPVLAVAGAEDHAYGPPEAAAVARAAGGRAVTVPRAGHSVALEAPDAVNDLLRGHFAASSARAAA
jgi:3-oxoadipate enol-lactonase